MQLSKMDESFTRSAETPRSWLEQDILRNSNRACVNGWATAQVSRLSNHDPRYEIVNAFVATVLPATTTSQAYWPEGTEGFHSYHIQAYQTARSSV